MAEVASAYVSLMPSAKGFGSKLSGEISGDIQSAGKKAGGVFGKVFAAGAGVLAGAGLGKLFSDSIGEAREAQKVGALTESVIKSTGGAAKVTAAQVGDLSSAISRKSGIDDEAIQSGANLLLTFKQVRNEVGKGNDIFNRATQAATDLSAAGFGDLNGQAKMLGKALNDPIKGMTALSRSGVTFTAAQQDQVKALVESGNALKAQKIILTEVESQVGGAAAATATAGDKAAVAFGNLKEQAGTALLPVVDRLSRAFTQGLAPAISGFISGMQNGTGFGGTFAAVLVSLGSAARSVLGFINGNRTAVVSLGVALAATTLLVQAHGLALSVTAAGGLAKFLASTRLVTTATKTWAAVQWALNAAMTANPIGLVVVAVAALAAAAVIAYKRSATFRGIVDGLWGALKTAGKWLADVAGEAAALASRFAGTAIPKAAALAALMAGPMVSGIRAAIGVIGSIIGKVGEFGTALVNGAQKAGQFLTGVQQKVGAALTFIQGIPGKVVAIFAGAGAAMYNAGAQLMGQLAAGIRDKIGDAIAAAQAGLSRLKGLLPGSPIKWGPLKNWNNGGAGKRLMDLVATGIQKATPKAVKAAQAAFGKIEASLQETRDGLQSKLDGLKSDFASIKEGVASAFTGNLFDVSATVGEDGGVLKTVGQNFIAGLMEKKGELTGLLASFKTLQGWGIDPTFLTKLFASGQGALITELAGMGKAGAVDTANLFGDVTNLGAQLGTAVAQNDPVAERIDETNRLLEVVTKQLDFLGSDIGKELNQAASKAQRDKKNRGKKGGKK